MTLQEGLKRWLSGKLPRSSGICSGFYRTVCPRKSSLTGGRQFETTTSSEEEIKLRKAVRETADIVWGDLLSFGEFEPSTRLEAQEFFRKHSYQWHHPWLEPALKFLEEFDLPPGAEPPFRQEQMVGRYLSVQGHGNPYLSNDLSERVAAADYALKIGGIRGRRAVIAKALNNSPLTRRTDDDWGPEEVRNRVKSYERQEHHFPADLLANRWIQFYRWAMYVERQPGIWPRPTV